MSSSPWVKKIKTDKIWICESVVKLRGIGKHGEVKMNEINIHAIVNLQRYVQSYGLPKLQIHGLGQMYEHGLVALPGETNVFHQRPQESKKSLFLEIWRDMDR